MDAQTLYRLESDAADIVHDDAFIQASVSHPGFQDASGFWENFAKKNVAGNRSQTSTQETTQSKLFRDTPLSEAGLRFLEIHRRRYYWRIGAVAETKQIREEI